MSVEEAIDRAMQELAVPPWYRESVAALVLEPPREWAPCCGAGCEPCVLTLQRVVARARRLTQAGTDGAG
ncbi:MAG: hypothetical protein K8H88_09375 [Sandaracinaceae bacterium]|nr:hypothetical protein [Sandaracinaceae bacterium]